VKSSFPASSVTIIVKLGWSQPASLEFANDQLGMFPRGGNAAQRHADFFHGRWSRTTDRQRELLQACRAVLGG
jgi:hypothetical protein